MCPRLFIFKYCARLEGKSYKTQHYYDNRTKGSLVHAGLAHYYAEKLEKKPAWYGVRSLEEEWQALAQGQPKLIEDAQRVVRDFRQSDTFDSWTPLAVEQTFSASVQELDPTAPIDNASTVRVDAKLDLVVSSNDAVIIVDHKSTDRGTKEGRLFAWNSEDNRYRFNFATLMYFNVSRIDIPRQLGTEPPQNFVVQRIKSSAPFDRDRHVIDLSAVALRENGRAVRAAVHAALRHLEEINSGRPIWPHHTACYSGSRCDFAHVCFSSSTVDMQKALREDFEARGDGRFELPRVEPR